MADDELSAKLNRRNLLNEGADCGESYKYKVFNPYTEFKEFSRKEIKDFEKTFKKYDVGNDSYLDLAELKLMMEKLGAPQTHLALKQMINEVDEDKDDKINFREFLLIYRKARQGELDADSGLGQLAALTEIDVTASGVGGAKNFFEAKISELSKGKKFEEEIRAEQDERKKETEEKQRRRKDFKEKSLIFASVNGRMVRVPPPGDGYVN
ncbi:EF-hand domain-containing protein D2 [Chamberlinius hualienensis]